MTTRRAFGRTWWGNAWVEAMERIDFNTNRLPRGRRYANYGRVREIKVEDASVFARVQGSRPTPYKIKINLSQFSSKQTKKIKNIISSNPSLASELTLGKLPESILDILDRQGVHLLPGKWGDIHADCSCPDWANPCKHLAAVYYLLANEIDKNPFLLFNLRGLSTEALVAAAGLTTAIPSEKQTQQNNIFTPLYQLNLDEMTSNIEEPDLSFPALDIISLFALLPDRPLFYPDGDFKKILLHSYKNVISAAETLSIEQEFPSLKNIDFYLLYISEPRTKALNPCPDTKSFWCGAWLSVVRGERTKVFIPSNEQNLEILHSLFPEIMSSRNRKAIRRNISIRVPEIHKDRIQLVERNGITVPTGFVFDLLLGLPLDTTLENNSPSSLFLNASTSVALALIRSASFIPEVVMKNRHDFSIRYVPLIHHEKIQKAIEYLTQIKPLILGFREEDGSVLNGKGVYDVLSMILTHIFFRYAEGVRQLEGDKLGRAFFADDTYTSEKFEEIHTGKTVADWLERLSIRKKDISPVIRIETSANDTFSLHIDIENKKDPLSSMLPLSTIFGSRKTLFSCPSDAVRTDVLRQITIASDYIPELKTIVNEKGGSYLILDLENTARFLTGSSNILSLLGIRLVIPKELKNLAVLRLAIKAKSSGREKAVSYLSLDNLLDFSWEIAIGDSVISEEEFIRLVKSAKGLIKFRDQYLLLEPEEVSNILDKLRKPPPQLSPIEVIRSALTGEVDGTLFNPDEALKSILDDLLKIEDITIPSTLNGQLRHYQERGFRWLYSNAKKGLGSCIADDMGLGKTIQVITLLLKLKEDKRLRHPALVVCPTTLVGNWYKECQRFAPSLSLLIYHGNERKLALKNKDVVITTYGILRRDIEKFTQREWGLAVIDEAQNIKNPDVDQTKAVKSVKANACIAMSGTPVENRLAELWSIFDFINRGYLGNLPVFQRRYSVPIEKYRDKERIDMLRRVTGPFILRRVKTDRSIISDLPEKAIFNEYCYLTKEQASLYQQVIETTMHEIQNSEGIERRGLIFKLITSLKQICNHPVHYSKKGKPLKELSGKSEKTMDLIQKIISMKEKALLFTQYREMGEILVDMIRQELKEQAFFFHGGIPRLKRDSMVEDFQQKDLHKVMVISLKAGGTGLNLTRATNVIHYDLWWNPAVEAQATDRTYRIGQEKNVMVYRLITIGTFEERIDEMIKAKKELADLTVATGEKWITELSDRELKEIFSLRAC
ncbi:MAG: DEAD/DEAH box helicase [Thermodesulfovibrionales bacterium]|nr:DEAD/DEAH box helicase [Thermodesulfovibrionales bacterium]